MSDYENEYVVTIKTVATYTFKTRADDDLYAIAETFENRHAWEWVSNDAYEVSVEEVRP